MECRKPNEAERELLMQMAVRFDEITKAVGLHDLQRLKCMKAVGKFYDCYNKLMKIETIT